MCAQGNHQAINSNSPSPFIERWIGRIAAEGRRGGPALDLAAGRGRHALCLAAAGFCTFAVDLELAAIAAAVTTARSRGLTLRAWCADLTGFPFPAGYFDLIVVARYLQRDLFDHLREALAPGGVLLYETFTLAQRRHGKGPTSRDHLLEPGELQTLAAPLATLFYEEVDEPDAVARLAARRASSRT